MLAEIALAALLADSTATAKPTVVRDTVYIERVITERIVPAAAAVSEPKNDHVGQYIFGSLLLGGAAYLIIHGSQNPTYTGAYTNGAFRIDKHTNSEVYWGMGCMALAAVTFSVK